MVKENPNHLTWGRPAGESFRALPRHGEPFSIFEWVTQKTIKCLALWPVYLVLCLILTVVTWVWLVPVLKGCTWLT